MPRKKILWHVHFGRGAGGRLAWRINKEGGFQSASISGGLETAAP